MNFLTSFQSKILSTRGGTWPNFFRWSAWYGVPIVLLVRTLSGFYVVLNASNSGYSDILWIPLAATAGLWLLSSTVATLAAIESGDKQDTLRHIATITLVSGLRIISIALTIDTVSGLYNTNIEWWMIPFLFLYTPIAFGNWFLFVDLIMEGDLLASKITSLMMKQDQDQKSRDIQN